MNHLNSIRGCLQAANSHIERAIAELAEFRSIKPDPEPPAGPVYKMGDHFKLSANEDEWVLSYIEKDGFLIRSGLFNSRGQRFGNIASVHDGSCVLMSVLLAMTGGHVLTLIDD